MKKITSLFSAFFLIASISFAQFTPTRDYSLYQPSSNSTENVFDLSIKKPNKPVLKHTQAQGPKLNESFEGTFPPSDWTLIDADGDGNNWIQGGDPRAEQAEKPISVHSGEKCAMSASWIPFKALTPNNYLITPMLKVSAMDTLSWWISTQDPSYSKEHYSVKVSTTDLKPSSFTTLFEETLSDTIWMERKVSLDQFAGQTIYIAFVHNESTNQFTIKLDDVSGPEILIYDHDAKIINPVCNYQTSTPINHFGSNAFSAQVKNIGASPLTDVKLAAKTGSTTIGESTTISSLSPGTTTEILTISNAFTPAFTGEYTFELSVILNETDSNMANNSALFKCTATDTTFTTTNDTIAGGVGGSSPATFGNIYTLAESDTLTSITVGFFSLKADLEFELAVYNVVNDSTAMEIMSVPCTRTVAMGNTKSAFTFNPQILTAGKYLFAVRQLTTTNITVGYDKNPNGYFYMVTNNTKCAKYVDSRYGNVMIEANFGHNARLIQTDLAVTALLNPVLPIGPYSKTENITVRVKNYGITTATNIPVNCSVNGTLLTAQSISGLAPNATHDVTFTTDLSAAITYNVKVFTSVAADEKKSNDTLKTTLQGKIPAAVLWNFNNGMPNNFTVVQLDNATVSPVITPLFPNNIAWTVADETALGKGPKCAVSTSWFVEETTKASRWMITPEIKLASGNSLEWDAKAQDPEFADGYEVRISTTGKATADFTKVLYTTTAENSTWITRMVDLSEYEGKDIYIAFVENSLAKFLIKIDNISIYGEANSGITNPQDDHSGDKFSIYPNPANNQTDIYAQEKINTIRVINTTGQVINVIENVKDYHYTLNTANLQTGIYFINIDTKKGKATQKLIISK